MPITDIAFHTGWNSIGTFGRVFHAITDESPTEFRQRERGLPNRFHDVPHCFVSAANRPHLIMAVSEKQRQRDDDKMEKRSRE